MRLIAGNAVNFPQGDAHRMGSQPGLPAASGARLHDVLARRPRLLAYGGGGAWTTRVCRDLACDARLARTLLAGLAPLVQVDVRGSSAGVWLEASLGDALAGARSQRPGSHGVLAKLTEVLFIEVLRIHMIGQAEGRTGGPLSTTASRVLHGVRCMPNRRGPGRWRNWRVLPASFGFVDPPLYQMCCLMPILAETCP